MELLILGGTVFLGRHLVDIALSRGHRVTLFNRGQHHPDLFPEVEKLRGDRNGDLTALQGHQWDAVIDTCGYVPRVVHLSATQLAKAVQHYTFISTISVYADSTLPEIDETAPLNTLEDNIVEEVTPETYGALKALCEQAAEDAMPGRVLAIRPGLIVGPYDGSDRFTYWPHRVAQGGEILAPGEPEQNIQFIDVRDLARWTIQMVEDQQTGIYNATGPTDPITMQDYLQTCKAISKSDAHFIWVSEEFLLEQGVQPYTEMPLWIPRAYANRTNCEKAYATGLTSRPLTDTVRDTLQWDTTRASDIPLKAGLTAETERRLLQLWHKQSGT